MKKAPDVCVSVRSITTIMESIPACTYSVCRSNCPVLSHRKLVCIKRFGTPAAVTARQQRTLSYAQLRHVRLHKITQNYAL